MILRGLMALLLAMVMAATALGAPAAGAQTCQLSIAVSPATVNYPGHLPGGGASESFGEVLDLNYTASIAGQTIQVQYLNGSNWVDVQNITANSVGFTETTLSLTTAWARLGSNTLRASDSSCSSAQASFSVVVNTTAVSGDVEAYLLVVLLGVGFYLIGRRTPFKIFLVFAAAVYLVIAPFTGQRYDIYFLLSSGIRMLQHVNPFFAGSPPVYPGALKWAYPPLYAVYSAASYLLYQALTGASIPSVSSLTWPGFLTSTYNVWLAFVPKSLPALVFLLKVPMVLSALGTGALLAKMTGSKASGIFWITNPLVILVAAIWGQLDPIATLLAVAAIYYYGRGKQYHAYLLASLGAAVKIWPALLVPLFLVGGLRREGRRSLKPLTAVLPSLAVTLGLYAAVGNFFETLAVLLYARGIPSYAGQFSVNGLTWQQALAVLGAPAVPIFLIVGIPIYGLILAWMYWKRDGDVTKWLVVSILVFYLTYNYVNPQYLYWVLPFLILQGRKLASWLFTALPVAYVAFSYNIFYFVSPAILKDEFSIGPSVVEQLKLSGLYSMSLQYFAVVAAVPTLVYLLLLRQELKAHRAATPTPLSPAGVANSG